MPRNISPPPLKRRRVAAPDELARSEATELSDAAQNDAEGCGRSISVFAWNINGIEPFVPASSALITSYFKPRAQALTRSPSPGVQRKSGPTSLRAWLARHDWPEVLFLQEVKINSSNTRLLSSLATSLNEPLDITDDVKRISRRYSLHTTLPRDKFNARGFGGKLYGVATILRADFESNHVMCVRDVPWDLEGRVSIVEMISTPPKQYSPRHAHGTAVSNTLTGTLSNPKPLALINVYAINGTSSPYQSPKTGRVTGTRHDRKLAFHTLLRDESLSLEAHGFDVVIAGDFNIARGPMDGHPNLRTWPMQHCYNRADFNTKFFGSLDNERAEASDAKKASSAGDVGMATPTTGQELEKCLDGVDVYRALHGKKRQYTYHPRTRDWGSSCDRVDLIIVSQSLWKSGRVVRTGILDSPQERGPSDHVPLWVVIGMYNNDQAGPPNLSGGKD